MLTDEDIKKLMTFYGADTLRELVAEQAEHVSLLQERLKPFLTEHHKITHVREG